MGEVKLRKALIVIAVLLTTTLWGSVCWAKEPATPEIKLNEALDMAIKNSKSLKSSALDIDKAKEEKENADDALSYTPAIGGTSGPDVESAWYSLLSKNLSWEMSKKTYASDEDSLVLSVCKKYWNIQKSLEDVKAKEVSASAAELAFRRVQAMVRLGMTPSEYSGISPEGVIAGAQAKVATAKSDLEKAKNQLNTDYEALNLLISLWPEDRPVLADEINFEPLKIDNLEQEVQRAVEKSPKVWLAQEGVSLAKYSYELMWASGQYKSFGIRNAEKEQAELEAMSAKEGIETATRNFYYTVRNLEAAIPAAENGVTGAEEALRVAKLSYDLGMITREDLLKSEAALEDAKKSLIELKTSHAYAKLAFQKPWAVSSGS